MGEEGRRRLHAFSSPAVRTGPHGAVWGVKAMTGVGAQALGQATKVTVCATCVQPSQARRRGRRGGDATARIQVGTCAQGPETGWEMRV